MTKYLIVLVVLLGLCVPAMVTADTKCVQPTVTYLGQGPGSFEPLLGDVGVFVGSTPPMFAGAADLAGADPVWSLRLGNIDPMEVRILPPEYHLLIGEHNKGQRVTLWIFGHDKSARFYDVATGKDLATVQPDTATRVSFVTVSDGWVAMTPTGKAYVMLPPCVESVAPAGTLPTGTIPWEAESPVVDWYMWLPMTAGNAGDTD